MQQRELHTHKLHHLFHQRFYSAVDRFPTSGKISASEPLLSSTATSCFNKQRTVEAACCAERPQWSRDVVRGGSIVIFMWQEVCFLLYDLRVLGETKLLMKQLKNPARNIKRQLPESVSNSALMPVKLQSSEEGPI